MLKLLPNKMPLKRTSSSNHIYFICSNLLYVILFAAKAALQLLLVIHDLHSNLLKKKKSVCKLYHISVIFLFLPSIFFNVTFPSVIIRCLFTIPFQITFILQYLSEMQTIIRFLRLTDSTSIKPQNFSDLQLCQWPSNPHSPKLLVLLEGSNVFFTSFKIPSGKEQMNTKVFRLFIDHVNYILATG